MTDSAMSLGVIFETTVFLHYFSNLPDSRQPGKLVYPLNEMLLLSLLGARRASRTSLASGRKSSACYAGFCLLPMVRHRMTGLARFLPRLTRQRFSGALSSGLRR